MDTIETTAIYYGPRDNSFKDFLLNIVQYTGASKQYLGRYINDETLPFFNMAFTSKTVNEESNYETFEQMGDATIGKFIVWSSYEKFPHLRGKSEAVEIIARMKINLGSKETLSQIAEDMGIWPYISASEDLRQRSKKTLLEDVFEAFIGALEYIIHDFSDPNYSQPGVAYQLIYTLLLRLFEPYTLKIDYNILVDPKNRLKGVFDQYKEQLGSDAVYKSERVQKNNKNIFITKVYDVHGNFLGEGAAALKKDAEKKASEQAILALERRGLKKTVPSLYNTY